MGPVSREWREWTVGFVGIVLLALGTGWLTFQHPDEGLYGVAFGLNLVGLWGCLFPLRPR